MGACESSILISAPHGNQRHCDELEDPLSHYIANKITLILRSRGFCVYLHSSKGKLGRHTVDYNRPEVMNTKYGRKFLNQLKHAKCHIDVHSFSDKIPWGEDGKSIDGKSIVILSHMLTSFEENVIKYIQDREFNVIRHLASKINTLTYTSYSKKIPTILLEFPYTKKTDQNNNCHFQVQPELIKTVADAIHFAAETV